MLESILLGLIQGLTEFLPVSSSGHLVLAQSLLPGFTEPGLLFDLFLHGGTLIAVILYFRKDLIDMIRGMFPRSIQETSDPVRESRITVAALVIATLPAAAAGMFCENFIEKLFESPRLTALMLCMTGIILFAGERKWGGESALKHPLNEWHPMDWFTIGCAQAVALIPGISRSGCTIAAALILGWSRIQAARFAFLMMLPAVSGAIVYQSWKILHSTQHPPLQWSFVTAGTLAAAVSGYAAIGILIRFIQKRKLNGFGYYCLAAGLVVFALNFF
ncbi:undecaprenyl-diphosphate phosphatase [bacterium]|nr:undecaprenyl-diphosphate phosphatase [candidate division CSSED10-310 bacterium]